MIRRVRVVGYKSLEEVTVDLQPLSVFLGPNAAGKSNLFDALGLLGRMATRKTLRDAFEEHRGLPVEAFSFGDMGLEKLLEKDSVQFTIEVDVELSQDAVDSVERRIRQMQSVSPEGATGSEPRRRVQESRLRYTLSVKIAPATGFLRVADERLVALRADGSESLARAAFIERIGDRLRMRYEGRSRPTEHELGLDYTLVSQPLYPPHYPHITAFKEELSRWHFYYLEPDVMREEVAPSEVLNVRRNGADLAAFFRTLEALNPRQFNALSRSLSLLLPGVENLRLETTREGLLQLKIIERGVPFPARLISEGTLRILGLLAITNPLAQSTVIGYEEPENGVHPRRLKLIADLLRNAAEQQRMQLLINTHSPFLPDYFEDDQLVVCRRRDRRTEFVPFRSAGPLFRRSQIEQSLEDATSLPERIRRGDLDD